MEAPFYAARATVRTLMGKVLIALIPGILVSIWFFGVAVLVQLCLATGTAVIAEAAVLRLRRLPIGPFLRDGSAVLTACLLALSIPPLSNWWLVVVGTLFAIIVAKHLYGGLGNNLFNPAMVGFVVLIISFPKAFTHWSTLHDSLSNWQQLIYIFTGQLPLNSSLDAITSATPLDTLKTQLSQGNAAVSEIMRQLPFGHLAGAGYELIALAFLLGALWLWQQRVISWRQPVAMLTGISVLALPLWLYDPAHYASPVFHLMAGATILGAGYIVTDPVTSPTTPRGQMIFGFLVGVIVYVIRVFGGFPDAVAFAVIIMNMAVPLIDQLTRPPVFGETNRRGL